MLRAALTEDPTVIEALAEGIILQDATGKILASNQNARRILRLDDVQLVGRSSMAPGWRALREDGTDFPRVEHPAMVTLSTGKPQRNVVMGIRSANREDIWISINTQPLFRPGEATPHQVIVSFSDITTFVEAKRIQQESEIRWRSLFENSMDGALLTAPDGTIFEANRAACEMLGRSRDELLRHGRYLVVDVSDPRLPPAIEERTRTGHFRGELDFLRADGSKFPAEVSSAVFQDGTGIQRTSMFFRDVLERKQDERRKNEFISTVSHELRTPLASIFGALRLLEGGICGALSVEMLEVLRIAVANTERLRQLIDDLLDIERIDAGHLALDIAPLPVKQALQAALDVTEGPARDKHIQIHVQILDEDPIHADAKRFGQVLVNLLSNAIKFSPPNAAVDLIFEAGRTGRTRIRVVDRGPGIPASFMARIFGRFQQVDASDSRAKGGTGLGLAICKAIVRQHGGDIGVESELGQGCTFWFELPKG